MKNTLILILIFSIICFEKTHASNPNPISNSSDLDVNQPKSPTTGALLKYLDFGATGNNGAPNISIPIYEVKAGELSLPISINYNATGIKVSDEAGNIGLNWNLLAGGVISRSVIGKVDDNSYYNDVYPALSDPTFSMLGSSANLNITNGIATEGLDGCPDLYSYNLPGSESGKFVNILGHGIRLLPKKDILIEEIGPNSDYPQINNYKITTENGIKYYFETLERTVSRSATTVSTSGFTWYLTKIVSSDEGETILLTYDNSYFDILTSPGESVTYIQNSCLANNPSPPSNSFQVFNNSVTIHAKQLKKIEFSNGTIEFELSYNREDLATGGTSSTNPQIDHVLIKNKSGVETEKVHFQYSYYNPSGNFDYKRLKLDELTFEGCITCGSIQPRSYKFEYNSIPLPEKFSKSIDHWGYYNHANNQTIIPSYPNASNLSDHCPDNSTSSTGISYLGANRNVNINYNQAGILNKITYPTGGYSYFNYEANEFNPSTVVDYDHKGTSDNIISTLPNGDDAVIWTPYNISIPINNLTNQGVCALAEIDYVPNETDPILLTHYKPKAEICEYDSVNDIYSVKETIYFTASQTHAEYSFTMDQGSIYFIILTTRLNGSQLFGRIRYNLPFNTTIQNYTGGLRLASLETYESINSIPIVKKYQYSGAYVRMPYYLTTTKFKAFMNFGICGGDANCQQQFAIDEVTGYVNSESTPSTQVLSATFRCLDPNCQYQWTKELIGANGENGYTKSNFDLVDVSIPEETREFWKQGSLLSKEIYNSSGILLKKSENTFITDTRIKESFPGLTTGSLCISQCFIDFNDANQFAIYSGSTFVNSALYHQLNSVWFYQDSKKDYLYDENGNNPVVTEEHYYYDNPDHLQLTRTKSTASNGDELWSYIKYVKDYNLSFTNDPYSMAMKSLNDQHINSVIQQISSVKKPDGTESVTGGSLLKFKISNGFPKPYESLSLDINAPEFCNNCTINNYSWVSSSGNLTYNSKFTTKSSYTSYNNNWDLLNFSKANDKTNSVQWLNNLRKPIAFFTNAIYKNAEVGGECSYSGFEDLGENDGWGTTNNFSENHTGNACFQVVQSSFGPTKDFLPDNQNQKFRFSCWIKTSSSFSSNSARISVYSKIDSNTDNSASPNVDGNYIAVPIENTSGQWKYYEAIIDLESIRSLAGYNASSPKNRLRCFVQNDATGIIYVDDIRFSPFLSEVKTFTYDPYFYEISSSSNERSIPEYYAYTGNRQLEFVLDQDKNVLSKNEYHYQIPFLANQFNYISTTKLLNEKTINQVNTSLISSDFQKSIQYLDGLGRLIQTSAISNTPDHLDLVAIANYDEFGREGSKYLPYKSGSNTGAFDIDRLTNQLGFYSNSTNLENALPLSTTPISQTVFEPSPLNRVKEQGAAGDDWQIGTYRTNRIAYENNSNTDNVLLWNVDLNSTSGFATGASCNSSQGNYFPENTLSKTTTFDENQIPTIEFKDNQGRLLLKRSIVKSINENGSYITRDETLSNGYGSLSSGENSYDTYYIYNDLGQLIYVIPPQASYDLNGYYTFQESDQVFKDYIYGYHYDEKGRLAEKKIPGQDGFNSFVYDQRNLLVLSQTPQQTNDNKWSFQKYDVLGRGLSKGTVSCSLSRNDIQNLVNTSSLPLWEKRIDNTAIYSEVTQPDLTFAQSLVYDSYSIYDDYLFDQGSQSFSGFNNTPNCAQNVFGLTTGTKTRFLDNSDFFLGINYYDGKSKLIQQVSQTILGWDKSSYEYNFTNQLIYSLHHQDIGNSRNLDIVTRNEYDHASRLIKTFKKVNSDPEIELAEKTYNDLGQNTQKAIHRVGSLSSDFMQYIDYRYNIRGWLTNINNASLLLDPNNNLDEFDAFGEEICYQDLSNVQSDQSAIVGIPQYNGNISAIKWKIRAPEVAANKSNEHLYVYRYDDLNRMTAGYYAHDSFDVPEYFNFEINKYMEVPDFDMMGNIIHLNRNDANGETDILDYSYSEGRLASVTDNASVHFQNDFNDANSGSPDYNYNKNGSITNDFNKELEITYNQLELPSDVSSLNLSQTGSLHFGYDVNGAKWTKSYNGTTHYYINGIEYEDKGQGPELLYISTEEGRIRPRQSTTVYPPIPRDFVYDYFLKDHLGNIRAVLSEENSKTEYYATMETQNGAVERQLFNNVDSTRDNRPPSEPVDSMYTTDFKVSRLNGASGNTIGIAKSLYVNQGDQISIETKYFFDDFQYNNSNISIEDLATALASTFVFNSPDMTNLSSEVKNNIAATEFTGNVDLSNFLSNAFGSNLVNDPSKPQAFLVYLFYDLNYQFIPEVSGILQVEDPNVLGTLAMLNLTIPKNGYFYMYTNNESSKTVNFNNTGLIHLTGALLEENHYYPFGKLITDLSGRVQHSSPKNNNYKYNGKELITDLSFDVEDYMARMYDPQIGRFTTVDPLAYKLAGWSPYNFCLGNPINFIDLDGAFPYPIHVRSFAPFSTFGGGFEGDGAKRGYSTALGKGEGGRVTSRMQHVFTVDPTAGSFKAGNTWSNESSHPLLGKATAAPQANISGFNVIKDKEGNSTISFTANMSAANPLVPGSPDIDVHTKFTLTENVKAGTLNVNAVQTGDAFPSAETFIGDTKGNQLFIGVSPAIGNPYTSLPGDGENKMMAANFNITLDKNGVFTGVKQGDKTYTTTDWNKMMQSKPTVKE